MQKVLLTVGSSDRVSLQLSSGVESLRLTRASVQTPCLEDSELQVQVTLDPTTSTGSRYQSSSPSSSGPSRTPTVAMAPLTPRPRCRRLRAEPPSWASTASVSWLPASSSAPSSGPETSPTSQNSQSQSRSVQEQEKTETYLCLADSHKNGFKCKTDCSYKQRECII